MKGKTYGKWKNKPKMKYKANKNWSWYQKKLNEEYSTESKAAQIVREELGIKNGV